MPYLSKTTISRFFTSECEKQLRLVLSPPTKQFRHERASEGMPPEQPPRPGLEQIAQAGQTWAEQKLAELEDVFGPDVLLGRRGTAPAGVTPRQVRFQDDRLATWIGPARAGQFLVECDFPVGPAFLTAMGIGSFTSRFNLHYADLRPDLIEVRAAGISMVQLTPAGEVIPLRPGDSRRQLRVIDIKLTSEPGPSYFAEVTYYSLALAGWLVDSGLDSQFVSPLTRRSGPAPTRPRRCSSPTSAPRSPRTWRRHPCRCSPAGCANSSRLSCPGCWPPLAGSPLACQLQVPRL
jgi:DNA replication ATP-dependent helicase/nuclease Dna2